MRSHRVPLRRSLVVRLLATSVLVAICAIVATAWLAVKTTTTAIRQEQGRSLADDTRVYRELAGYAATHKNWAGVTGTVDALAQRTGRRITLLTEDRKPIADSLGSGPPLRTARPSATVDALNLDQGLTGGGDTIDPRASGPYTLTADDRKLLRKVADGQVNCLADSIGIQAHIVETPSGRPQVVLPPGARIVVGPDLPGCAEVADERTETENAALDSLSTQVKACLGPKFDSNLVLVNLDFTVITARKADGGRKAVDNDPAVLSCVESQRREQLKPYVAQPALLFVTDPADGAAQPRFNLSKTNALRIAGVTGSVLVLAILITILVGVRLVRPLRALTAAARQPVDLQHRVPVTTDDEIGHLAAALNDLSDRRERAELQRKAMVGDVAHELRSPLTNIRSWLEAALDDLAAVDPQLLTLLLDEAILLQHIIDDLRDLAAADAGNLRIHPEAVYINDALEQVAEANRGAAETGGVRLRTETSGDPEILVDPVRVRQLVGNLVSNAVRHTPAGGTVTVRSEISDGQLAIDVIDTGVGIAAADLSAVFDRFWRADGSRNRATGGSGLGLAIARKLAEAHGGDITVTSRLGAGSTFSVRLPAVSPSAAPDAKPGGRHGGPIGDGSPKGPGSPKGQGSARSHGAHALGARQPSA